MNPNSSSLGVDVTFLLVGATALAVVTPVIGALLRWRVTPRIAAASAPAAAPLHPLIRSSRRSGERQGRKSAESRRGGGSSGRVFFLHPISGRRRIALREARRRLESAARGLAPPPQGANDAPFVALALVCLLSASACNVVMDPDGDPSDEPTDPSAARVRVAQLSPDAPPVDFCLAPAGTQEFAGPVLGGAGAPLGISYANVTRYFEVDARRRRRAPRRAGRRRLAAAPRPGRDRPAGPVVRARARRSPRSASSTHDGTGAPQPFAFAAPFFLLFLLLLLPLFFFFLLPPSFFFFFFFFSALRRR